jgi:hypothetical protein
LVADPLTLRSLGAVDRLRVRPVLVVAGVVSVRPMRELYRAGDAEFIVGAGSPKLDEPMTDAFESWAHRPATGGFGVRQLLEYECRKFPGWYPIAADGSDLPSSQAALEDDGLTVEQALALLRQIAPGARVDKDTWMRKATKGAGGYPAPARHNGDVSLWSERDIRAFADRIAALADVGARRQAARGAARAASAELQPLVAAAIAGGAHEEDVQRWAGVDRATVRKWAGK